MIKISVFMILGKFRCIFLFSGFQTWFYQMRWFYPYRSFKTASDDVTN